MILITAYSLMTPNPALIRLTICILHTLWWNLFRWWFRDKTSRLMFFVTRTKLIKRNSSMEHNHIFKLDAMVKGQQRPLNALIMLYLSTFGISLKTQNITFTSKIKIQNIIESIDLVLAKRLTVLSLLFSFIVVLLWQICTIHILVRTQQKCMVGWRKDLVSAWISCPAPWWEACETLGSTSRRSESWSRNSTTGRICLNGTSLNIW